MAIQLSPQGFPVVHTLQQVFGGGLVVLKTVIELHPLTELLDRLCAQISTTPLETPVAKPRLLTVAIVLLELAQERSGGSRFSTFAII